MLTIPEITSGTQQESATRMALSTSATTKCTVFLWFLAKEHWPHVWRTMSTHLRVWHSQILRMGCNCWLWMRMVHASKYLLLTHASESLVSVYPWQDDRYCNLHLKKINLHSCGVRFVTFIIDLISNSDSRRKLTTTLFAIADPLRIVICKFSPERWRHWWACLYGVCSPCSTYLSTRTTSIYLDCFIITMDIEFRLGPRPTVCSTNLFSTVYHIN